MFTYVKCQCGRTLRAQRSVEKTIIQCWDCKAKVTVHRYRPQGVDPISRLRDSFDTASADTFAASVLFSMATTTVLMIPKLGGLAAGLVVLSIAALHYLERVRNPRLEVEEDEEVPRPNFFTRLGQWFLRFAIALLFVLGMTLPFGLSDGTREVVSTEPLLPPLLTIVVAFFVWILLPLVVYLSIARDAEARLGVQRGVIALRRRWVSVLVGLLMLPIAFALMEGLVVAGLVYTNTLGAFAYDLLPLPAGSAVESRLLWRNGEYFTINNFATPWQHYLEGLSRGSTIIGSIPLSLHRGLSSRLQLTLFGITTGETYLIARLAICFVALAVTLLIMAIQSTLFGRISLAAPPRVVEEGDLDEDTATESASTTEIKATRDGLIEGSVTLDLDSTSERSSNH